MPTKKPVRKTTKKNPTKATTYSTGLTRKQINKEKADMIRKGYGAPQPTKKDARKGKRGTSKIGSSKTVKPKRKKNTASGYNSCVGTK